MKVGLDRGEHLWFQQQLAQLQSIDGVALQHLHHTARKVRANVAEPPSDRWRRRAEPTRARPCPTATWSGVVDSGQCGVDARVHTIQLQPGDTLAGTVSVALLGAAEHHPPATRPLAIADATRELAHDAISFTTRLRASAER